MGKKSILVLLVLGLVATFASVAFPNETLSVFAPPWIFKKFPLEEVTARFEADHPGVTVELTRSEKWSPVTYIAAWRSGESPFDVFVGGTGSMLGASVLVGDWLEPLDDVLSGNLAVENFVEGALACAHFKKPDGSGGYYPVLPFMISTMVMGVNTNYMKAAGLWENGEPVFITSWDEDEFFEWFDQLKTAGALTTHLQNWDREYMQYNYCAPINAMTGTFLAEDGKGFDVTSEAAYRWLGYVQRLYEEGIGDWVITDASGYGKWNSGTVASYFDSQGHHMELVSVTGNESDIAYLRWPGAVEAGSVVWAHSAWIPKASSQKDLAKAYIREAILSQYFQQWDFNRYGKLPTLKAYYGDGITRFEEEMPLLLEVANGAKPIPVYKDLEKYLDILATYLPDAVFGRISVDNALQSIQEASKDLDFTNLRFR